MDSHKIAIKIFARPSDLTAADFVPVFHRWIQGQVLADHLLIDVTDYDHVPDGPGVMLIGKQANLSMDCADGRLGLRYFRKCCLPGTVCFAQRLGAVLAQTFPAANRLQSDAHFAGRLSFNPGDLQIRINDRLHAPNTTAGYQQLLPQIQTVANDLLGSATLTPTQNPLSVFEVSVQAITAAQFPAILEKLPI